MNGFIFLCSNKTEKECLERLLFGTSSAEHYEKYFIDIKIGDTLFLYNFDNYTLQGPFQAISSCTKDLVPAAWLSVSNRGYCYQVRVDGSHTFKKALVGNDLSSSIPFHNGYPSAKISEEISKKIVDKLSRVNQIQNLDNYYQENINSYYIFKCDRITGGKVFDDNVLGAKSELFPNIVSKIQEGDKLFVWMIEERKVYGVWKANSRGQYNPLEFTNFPAVVYCSREINYLNGLTEIQLRNILPFDTPHPPYRIQYKQGLKIIEELNRINNIHEIQLLPPSGQFKSEDGHIVRSQGELIIDNWLFRNTLTHAYEYRIQRDEHLITDFYLPERQLCIEYWGMINNEEYRRRKNEKVSFYRKHKINLIELFPKDLSMLSEILKVKLSQFNIHIS